MGKEKNFNTIEELQELIDSYFQYCKESEIPPTITGLALSLGITRENLISYKNKDEFAPLIQKAKLEIEHLYELRLIKRGNSADIFALRVLGWNDKSAADNGEIAEIHEMPTIVLDGVPLEMTIGSAPNDVSNSGDS